MKTRKNYTRKVQISEREELVHLESEDYIILRDTYDYLKSSKAKVYVITKNNLVQELEYVNEVILVPIKHDLYNYTLQCLVDLIFMKYQKNLIK